MSLFSRRASTVQAHDLIPRRPGLHRSGTPVNNETALRHSAVWACLRLRANLISTLPVDVFRRVDGRQVEVAKPRVLVSPGGDQVGLLEWLYSTQFDLDRSGNCFGLITERDARGLPARIELLPLGDVTVEVRGGRIDAYRVGGDTYDPSMIWHERQYTVAGLCVGLSPIAYAAWSIGEYLSVQEFAGQWFDGGAIPSAHLRNTAKTLTPEEAQQVKERFRSSINDGDLFVTGNDWDYQMIGAQQSDTSWLDAKKYSVGDVARFFDVPGDLVGAETASGSITYANVTQRNLQFLIMHLGPAIVRRESALTDLTHGGKYVKFNTDALLRMDPFSRIESIGKQIEARTLTPNEAREIDNRPPLTAAQLDEFAALFSGRQSAPTSATAGAS